MELRCYRCERAASENAISVCEGVVIAVQRDRVRRIQSEICRAVLYVNSYLFGVEVIPKSNLCPVSLAGCKTNRIATGCRHLEFLSVRRIPLTIRFPEFPKLTENA